MAASISAKPKIDPTAIPATAPRDIVVAAASVDIGVDAVVLIAVAGEPPVVVAFGVVGATTQVVVAGDCVGVAVTITVLVCGFPGVKGSVSRVNKSSDRQRMKNIGARYVLYSFMPFRFTSNDSLSP
jgi:hypothetical protein